MTELELPRHRLYTGGVSAIFGGENISITSFTLDGRDTPLLVIPDILYLFKVVPSLIEINEKLGFKLENLFGKCSRGFDEEEPKEVFSYGKTFFHDIKLYKDDNTVLGSPNDRSRLCFDYGNYYNCGGEDENWVDRVEYRTARLEENLDNPNKDITKFCTISRKHHGIGLGAFA